MDLQILGLIVVGIFAWLPSNALAQDPNDLPNKDIIIEGDEASLSQLRSEHIPYLINIRKLEIYNLSYNKRPTFPEDPNKLPDLSELINLSNLINCLSTLLLRGVLYFPPKYFAEKEELKINGSIMILKSDK